MPRKPRIEKIGFYHVINRGVARSNVYFIIPQELRQKNFC